jgi:hypothetical protein
VFTSVAVLSRTKQRDLSLISVSISSPLLLLSPSVLYFVLASTPTPLPPLSLSLHPVPAAASTKIRANLYGGSVFIFNSCFIQILSTLCLIPSCVCVTNIFTSCFMLPVVSFQVGQYLRCHLCSLCLNSGQCHHHHHHHHHRLHLLLHYCYCCSLKT